MKRSVTAHTDRSGRPLTAAETELLPREMAAAVDLKAVRIVSRHHNPIAALFGASVVRGHRIFWANAPAEATTVSERAHLAHELVHVWHYKFLKRSGFELLLHRRYRYDLRRGAAFADYGYEQQAAIVEDSVRIAAGRRPRWAVGEPATPDAYAAAITTCAECRPRNGAA